MKNSGKKDIKTIQQQPLTIVGIGASAGGLKALKMFFEKVPEDSGLAYVVVVHLSPDHKSLLSQLLQPYCKIPVRQVTKTLPIEPNKVYVIPPGSNLNTIDTHLRLTKLEEKRSNRAPIDHFFRALAKTHDGHAIGVILTGTGTDGALGIKEIKGRDGMVIAQDPTEAEYDGMPQNAIATGTVDMILPISEMPDQIINFANTIPRLPHPDQIKEKGEEIQMIQKIFTQVKAVTGKDFSQYKISTIMRRIQRRMQLYQIQEIGDYLQFLRKNTNEVIELADDFLITVTNFFRDPNVFDYLKEKIIPGIFSNKNPEDQVRIWSVGCSSGEEAYSLAILLLEESEQHIISPTIQIFASDLHEHSLKMAREGFYPGDIEVDVSEERLRRFFKKENGGYRVRKEIREMVIFTPHNLLGDPPFSRINLIMCRNLLIYLKREVQPDVINLFHYSLWNSGFLVLGPSENLDNNDLFKIKNKEFSVFTKLNVTGPESKLPVFPLSNSFSHKKLADNFEKQEVSYGTLHQQIIEHFGPPSILVNSDHKILHLSENAGRYLGFRGGEPSRHLFSLIREELKIELRALLHATSENVGFVRSQPVSMNIEGKPVLVQLSVRSSNVSFEKAFILILFEEFASSSEITSTQPVVESNMQGSLRKELENELYQARRRLQTVIEEYDTTREEMKASNEELQSANEELRSTMEELETSKEELQSVNEELTTVNQENRHKVEELSQLTSDLQNLLAATDIATLFLDKEFRILRFTPRLGELFSIRQSDRGRPITDITQRLGYNELTEDVSEVLKTLIPIERELIDEKGRWFLTRISPYRSTADRIEGIVITFVDISSGKKSENKIRESEASLIETRNLLTLATNASGIGWGTWNMDTGETFWDERGCEILGFEKNENTMENWFSRILPEDRPVLDQQIKDAIANDKPFDLIYRITDREGGIRHIHGTGMLGKDTKESGIRGSGLVRDVTHQLKIQQQKDDFMAIASHELKTPISVMKGYVKMIEGELREKNESYLADTLKKVDELIRRMTLLINDLLDVTRIEAGKLEFSYEIFDFDGLVNEVFESMQYISANKLKKKGHTGKKVEADRERTSQVIINLISNAIKFSPAKSEVTIELSTQNEKVICSVKDRGIGISVNDQKKVFERFSNIDSLSYKHKGLGIGLFISAEIVRRQGGDIWVKSTQGKGSTFSFSLPEANQ